MKSERYKIRRRFRTQETDFDKYQSIRNQITKARDETVIKSGIFYETLGKSPCHDINP